VGRAGEGLGSPASCPVGDSATAGGGDGDDGGFKPRPFGSAAGG
jgi:hypothetical protein